MSPSIGTLNGIPHSISLNDLSTNLNEENIDLESEEVEFKYNEEEDDPLGVKKLALSFDYLVYQITEKVQDLALQTEETVKYKKKLTEDQLNVVDESVLKLKALLDDCKKIDDDFTKLEQISFIVSDFKKRIRKLENYFKNE